MKSKELIEKLNTECIELKNSREYAIGRKIFNLKRAIINLDFPTILKTIKYQFIKNRIPNTRAEKFFYNAGKSMDAEGVVYTCITGGYDIPKEPLYEEDNVEYKLFTDNINTQIKSKWQQENIKDLKFSGFGNLVNRYCKMNPFALFENKYDYALYIDGNVQIISCISDLYSIAKESPIGIAMHKHSVRNCIYDEAIACTLYKRGNKDKIFKQVREYRQEGFPEQYGLYEATIIIVDLHNTKAKNIFHQWWNEYLKSQSMRDQLSLPYVVWKNKYKFDDIGILGNNLYKNPKFRVYSHK